jgi:hypothetical protein
MRATEEDDMNVTEAARAIVALAKENYGAPATLAPTDETKFPHLELDEYHSFRAGMEIEGFSFLCDLDMLEISQSPTTLLAPAMIRVMVSADSFIVTDHYQVKPRIWRRLKLLASGLLSLRLLDAPLNFLQGLPTRYCTGFETEFDNGTFLVSSNAQSASMMSGPTSIENQFFPFGTPVSTVHEAHRTRLAEIVNSPGGPKPLAIRSLDELLRMQKRQSAHKVAHRAACQWVTRDELHQYAQGNAELADSLYSEVQRMLAEDRTSA